LAGKKPCVYMQNAGLGHAINPLTSLCVPCGIPVRLIIGHRHSLPQHKVMGDIDGRLLDLIGWEDAIMVHGSNNES
jgi:phosphonopyruvate decarboxylase